MINGTIFKTSVRSAINASAMKRKLSCFIFFTTCLLSYTQAQDYRSAVGIRFSSHVAAINHSISGKHFFSSTIAGEGLLSVGNSVAIGALVEKHYALAEGLKWLYGGGAYAGFGDSKFGLQGVIGLDYKWLNIPINFSIDWKPEISVAPDFTFEPAAVGFTARFTLK